MIRSGNNRINQKLNVQCLIPRCGILLLMIIKTFLSVLFVWFMPKRLTRQEIYTTFFVMAALTRTTDQVLDLVLKLYDQLEPGVQWQVIIIQSIFPAAIGIIILNFMPKHKLPFVCYAVAWVALSVGLEWISIQAGYLTYHHWSLWYSAGVYLIGIIYLRLHLSFLRAEI